MKEQEILNIKDDELYAVKELNRIFKMSTSNIYRLMSLGEFPRPIRIGTSAKRWTGGSLKKFVCERIEARG
jgi:predicted DNA-binding transcriptional regulator AlpA